MSDQCYPPAGLPQGSWGRELKGRYLSVNLMSNPAESFECKVVNYERDFENWHTCFISLRKADGEIINVNPLAIAQYQILEVE